MKSPLVLPTDSETLVLRQFTTPEDDTKLFELIEANRQYWKDIAYQYPDLEDVRDARLDADDEQEFRLGIVDNGNLFGWVSLIHYDAGDRDGNWLGAWVDKPHTGQGYATLAARAVIKYVRDNRELNRTVTTTTLSDNIPSRKVIERVGFKQITDAELPLYAGPLVFRLLLDEV